jgi:hypothetical protein
MCNSVFQYFTSEKQAILVLLEFVRITKKKSLFMILKIKK